MAREGLGMARYLLLILALLVALPDAACLLAKGLGELSPAAVEKSSGKNNRAKARGKSDAPVDGLQEGDVPSPVLSKTSLYLRNRLFVAAGLGWVTLKKESRSWRSGGASDLQVSFDVQHPVMGAAILATFRYAPVEMAPRLRTSSLNEEYKGVAEFWMLGGEARYSLNERVEAIAIAEFGLATVHLIDLVDLADEEQPEKSGAEFIVGAGADATILGGLRAGPRLRIGFGSFSKVQLSAQLTFVF